MSRFIADPVMQFSDYKIKCVVLPGDRAAFRSIGQFSECPFKSFEPAKGLFRGTVFGPPKRLLQQLAFGTRKNCHPIGHV